MLSTVFNKIQRSVAYRLANTEWERLAIHNGFSVKKGEPLYIKEIDFSLPYGKFDFLLRSLQPAIHLAYRVNAKFQTVDDSLIVELCGLKFNPQTPEDLYILDEIYVEGCYNFDLPGSFSLIDIGMNVGMASLYFATHKPNIASIYSFEPFKPTYEQAMQNYSLNKEAATRIKPHLYGLGKRAETLQVDYSYEHKGRAGLGGTELVKDLVENPDKQEIIIKDITEELTRIFTNDSSGQFVMKIDCEGAEYGIFEVLGNITGFEKVKIIMLEWHEKGPKELTDKLIGCGFASFSFQPFSEKAGMVYAIRM